MEPGEHRRLRQRTVAGVGWKFASVAVSFVSQFAIGVVLARLLPPEDFGLLGLAMIVVGFGNVFVNLGLGPALEQRQKLEERHVRVAFTVSVLSGLALCALVYAAAPYAARFLGDGRITKILEVLSLSFVLSGFYTVSAALLRRRLDFRRLMVVEVISSVVGYGGLAVALAFMDFGVWSLVYAALLQRLLSVVVAYGFVRHAARPLFSAQETKDLASFGAGISLASVFNYFALQGDYFVVGRVLGPGPLGLYTRAYTLMTLPTSRFVQSLGSVLFPAMSKVQHDPGRFRRAYLDSLSVMSFVTIPILAALVALAPELVAGIYGEKWMGAVAPLQILGCFGAFRAMYNGAASFLRAKGWVYRILLCQVVYGTCMLVGTWQGAIHLGLEGVAGAVGLAITVMWACVIYFSSQATHTRLSQVLMTMVPGGVLAAPLVAACLACKYASAVMGLRPLWTLLAAIPLGLFVVGVALFTFPQWLFGGLPRKVLASLEGAVPTWGEGVYRRVAAHFDGADQVVV